MTNDFHFYLPLITYLNKNILLKCLHFTLQNKTVYCTASILQFPVHNGWWYRGCSKCFKQLKQRQDTGELICPKHDVQIAVPW